MKIGRLSYYSSKVTCCRQKLIVSSVLLPCGNDIALSCNDNNNEIFQNSYTVACKIFSQCCHLILMTSTEPCSYVTPVWEKLNLPPSSFILNRVLLPKVHLFNPSTATQDCYSDTPATWQNFTIFKSFTPELGHLHFYFL